MLIDLSCPVENQGILVKTNTETNEPYLLLKLFNLSEKTISSLDFHVLAYDANGNEIGSIPVSLSELDAKPKTYFAENKAISLSDVDDAKNFVVVIDKAIFDDETEYTPSEEYTIDADTSEASIEDVMLLRELASEAICFASENNESYRCVCGRTNLKDANKCARCGRVKSDVLEIFATKESVTHAIESAKAHEDALLKEAESAKKAKCKKTVINSVLAVLCVLVVALVALFGYKSVLNLKGNNALKKGEYLKAYEAFEKSGSKKISEVTKYVQGNTPENLLFQSGLMAEDEENLYYLVLDNLSYSFNLVKENKSTGEKVTLTDAAGGSLNVTEDLIYFVAVDDGTVKSITKDGATIESVLDTPVSYMSVVGNSMYYIKTDYDNPNKLSEEQCMILAQQGQMETFNHLYKMNLKNKKSKLLNKDSMSSISIYGERIYYLSESSDEWQSSLLCSVNLNGKDKKTVVDTPVASFLISGDDLYYINMYRDVYKDTEITSIDALDYTAYRKNLKDGSTSALAEDYMVTYLNTDGKKLYFIALDRVGYMGSMMGEDVQVSPDLYSIDFETGEMKQMVSGEVQIFNITGDDMIMFISSQGMCRMKTDGSGFEQLIAQSELDALEAESEEDTTAEETIIFE